MSANANTIIFRYTNSSDDYRNPLFTDQIQMDIGTIPDSTGHVRQTNWTGQVSLQENPQPTLNRPHDVQDMGLGSFEVELAGFVEAPPSSAIPAIILSWLIQPKQNTNFTFGRFGIKTTDFPAFDSEPTANSGYNLEYVQLVRPGEFPKVDLILRFKYNGTSAGLGVIRT